jgi:hypothetical protein
MLFVPWIIGLCTVVAVPTDVETAACGYRVAIYGQFHGDLAEYDRRRETADALLRTWKQCGQTEADSARLARWYADAREAIRQDQTEPTAPLLSKHAATRPASIVPPDDQSAVPPGDDEPSDDELGDDEPSDDEPSDDELGDEELGGTLSALGRVLRNWARQ